MFNYLTYGLILFLTKEIVLLTMRSGGKKSRMRIIKLIFFMILVMPLMLLLSGCFDDSILDAMISEKDFVAPFDVVLSDEDRKRTSYFKISDTGRSVVILEKDDASYEDVPHARSFTPVYNDKGILDNVTKLIWMKCTALAHNSLDNSIDCSGTPEAMPWSHAIETCDTAEFEGHSDWRLPTISELNSILDYDKWPLIDTSLFPNSLAGVNQGYWVNSSRIFLTFTPDFNAYEMGDYSWVVFFGGGGVFGINSNDLIEKVTFNIETEVLTVAKQFVRCVRSGDQ